MYKKQLYRSTRDRKVGGVIGGISEYFRLRPSSVRILYVVILSVLLIVFRPFGAHYLAILLFVIYFGLWLVLPTDVKVWTQRVRRSRGTYS